jgi:hypothetical protein
MAGANAGHFIAASTGWRQAEPVANSQIWRPAARFLQTPKPETPKPVKTQDGRLEHDF